MLHGASNATNNEGCTPIWSTALWICPVEAFKILIDKGANISDRNANGETLLMQVCSSIGSDNSAWSKQENKAQFLIEKGIDINAQSDLSLATRDVNQQLEGLGISRNAAKSGNTALMFAARRDDLEMVKLLIAHEADANLSDELGQTALIHACLTKEHDNAVFLLDNKADPNSVDNTGMTALMIAVSEDDTELVKTLLAKGADVKFKNDDDKTAADYVIPDGKVAKALGDQLSPKDKPDDGIMPSGDSSNNPDNTNN